MNRQLSAERTRRAVITESEGTPPVGDQHRRGPEAVGDPQGRGRAPGGDPAGRGLQRRPSTRIFGRPAIGRSTRRRWLCSTSRRSRRSARAPRRSSSSRPSSPSSIEPLAGYVGAAIAHARRLGAAAACHVTRTGTAGRGSTGAPSSNPAPASRGAPDVAADRKEVRMAAKILVVDDDPNVQRLLTYTLKQEGYEVVVAADGAEGFRLWGAEQPALILLDVMLPKLDGYQVATKIRAEEGDVGHVPIIMLTAEREVEQKVRGLRAGADDYLDQAVPPGRAPGPDQEPARPLRAAATSLVGRPPLGPGPRVLRRQGRRRDDDDRDQRGDRPPPRARPAGLPRRRQPPVRRPPRLPRPRPRPQEHRRRRDARRRSTSTCSGSVLVEHDSGDRPAARAALARDRRARDARSTCRRSSTSCAALYDYVLIDIDKRLDDINLGVLDAADTIFVVMTADLSCLKNVRLVLETIGHLGYEARQGPARPQPLERLHRDQREERRGRAEADDRPPDPQRVPRRDQRPEQRRAVHVHEGRFAARAVAPRLRPGDRQAAPAPPATARRRGRQRASLSRPPRPRAPPAPATGPARGERR